MTAKNKTVQDAQGVVKPTAQPVPPKLEEQKVDPHLQEIVVLKDRLARAMADYSNLEKRYERDSASVVKFATSSLLTKLLDIRDHLYSASTHFQDKSLTMILGSFDQILAGEGVETIKTDGNFDPVTMECAETVEGEKDKVIAVQRLGYKLYDKVLRPARVTVGRGSTDNPEPAERVGNGNLKK